ncbi:VOC family protein [Candidatus Dependentiae bacterium]|nr:VOC family protein [Candidatus Dependentiae bacterium]
METKHPIRVGMIIFMEPNVDAAVDFYKKLGFPVAFHLAGKWAELQIGTVKLGLCPTDMELYERHTGVILEVDDVAAMYNDLKAAGVEFVREPFEAVHGIMASFKDPGLNIIDLYQPTPEKVHELATKIKNNNEECNATQECNNCSC